MAFTFQARRGIYIDISEEMGKLDNPINAEVAAAAMDMLKVDACGFDTLDRRLLRLIIDSFDGGPVGVDSIAAALSEERGTVEDVLEPFLIQQGYMSRNNGDADLFSGK